MLFANRPGKANMFRHIAVLMSGSVLSQFIGVLAAPILSRLYSPENFGILGSLLAITGVVSAIGSLKYEMAIVIENNDRKADVLQFLSILILSCISVIAFFGLCIVSCWIEVFSDKPLLVEILPWGSLIIFFSGLFSIFSFRLSRAREYEVMAIAGVVRRIGMLIVQVVLGFIGFFSVGLVVGNIFGSLLCVSVLFPAVLKVSGVAVPAKSELLSVAKDHYKFALYSTPQNLINALSQNVPIFFLGNFFGAGVVGSYFLAVSILQLPSSIIVQAVRQVYYREAACLIDNPKKMLRLFCRMTGLLALVSLPLILVFFFNGVFLFSFILGDDWSQAGEFAAWMSLWVGVGFMNAPAVSSVNVLGLQKFLMVYDFFLLVGRALSLYIFCQFGLPMEAIMAFSIVGVLFNVLLITSLFLYLLAAERRFQGNNFVS